MIEAKFLQDDVRNVYPNGVDCHGDYSVGEDNVTFQSFMNGDVTVDKLLDNVDLELKWYIPSLEAIDFVMFIRLVLGEEPENNNPAAHYFMIDCIFQSPNVVPFFMARGIDFEELKQETVVLCSREFSKSTLVTYLLLYMAEKGKLDVFGNVNYGLYVSDSMRNGVKKMMGRLKGVYNESIYLQGRFEEVNITQEEAVFIRRPRTKREKALYHEFVVKQKKKPENVPGRMKRTFKVDGLGCAALNLDARLHTENGTTTIRDVSVGDEIYGADGQITTVTYKSEVFEKPMYKLQLEDGRSLSVCQDHINSVELKYDYKGGRPKYKEADLTTIELLSKELYWERSKKKKGVLVSTKEKLVWVKNMEPMEYPERAYPVDPYTLGLLLGDGSTGNKYGAASLHMMLSDMKIVRKYIPYGLTQWRVDPRSPSQLTTVGIPTIVPAIVGIGCNVTCKDKFIPGIYLRGSVKQRLDLLRGLIDTDGEVSPSGKIKFYSTSIKLVDGVTDIVRSLGGTVFRYDRGNCSKLGVTSTSYIAEISLAMRVSNLPRKYNNQKPNRMRDHRVGVVSVEPIEIVPSQCIAVDNEEHQFVADDYFRTHNTSSRGASNVLTRPQFVFIDDVVANEVDASSATVLNSIESTIEADIRGGLSGSGYFIVAIGTPYNKVDPIYRRVEEGLMLPVVFPRAAKMPIDEMKEEDFESVWPDRHSYIKCRREYRNAKKASDNGNTYKMRKLIQEHYLRISSEEEKLVKSNEIQWYNRSQILKNIGNYNLYATTDFTASNNITDGDYSGSAIWAVNSNGEWFLIDLALKRMGIEEQYEPLFNMVQTYGNRTGKAVTVFVETNGQQQLNFVSLKKIMREKNIFFSFGRQLGKPWASQGISRSGGDKHQHFMRFHPMMQNKKVYFAEELKNTPDMTELIEELSYITYRGINSKHDDGLDLLSMIPLADAPLPSHSAESISGVSSEHGIGNGIWEFTEPGEDEDYVNSTVF